jgi:uncharacterized membrane protein
MLKRLTEALHIPASWYRLLLLLALSLFFINVGVDHFINPDFYLNIMPDYLPFHAEAVYLSGFFEILGGIVVLIPKLRALARWGLISLLIAVFPANIYMAMNPNLFPEFSLELLYFRLPLQFVFIFLVLKATEMVRD